MTDLSSLDRVWTRKEALALVKPGIVRGYLLDGVWQSPWPGVYMDGGFELDADRWAMACVLATKGKGRVDQVVMCGRTAARVWGIVLIDDRDPATGAQDYLNHDVSCARHLETLSSVPVGSEDPVHLLHRHQFSFAEDELRELFAYRITSPARTLLDLCRLISFEALVCAIDSALHENLVTLEELQAMAQTRHGLAYGPAFADAIALSDGRAESPAETLARLLLLPHLPGLEPQVKVNSKGRTIARLDLADETIKLAIETDGRRGHAGEAMAAKDHQRDAKIGALGWWTERITWYELRRQPELVLKRVLDRAAKRRARAG